MIQAIRETQAMANTSFWGQVFVFLAHDGIPLCEGSVLVALKMEKEAESIDRMIRLQLKLTPLSANLAMRTLALIFYRWGKPKLASLPEFKFPCRPW